ncbi:hypothetical protein HU230_0036330 [Bradyrhizobium quebecense]|uniref:hypothetical protein n=1 Tax=Bradyrhizobium quebecense TaxID=2748629 RepID=UPI001AEF26F7|nr:hypothetical protein [Bradyrhizobium quebecense]UGA43660.1 hypothetical protein HU230_0036330 [Bradyrhizobium quebecense]
MITQPSPFPLTERRTLRTWLSSMMRSFDHGCGAADVVRAEPVSQVSIGSGIGTELGVVPVAADVREEPRGEVVAFPVHGEALLVKLADLLRRRVAGREPADNPLRLTISRCPWTRLSIDATAYVDYLSDVETFHAAIEAGPDTKVILKTTDFDALAGFVMQYVNDRLLDRASVEAAP